MLASVFLFFKGLDCLHSLAVRRGFADERRRLLQLEFGRQETSPVFFILKFQIVYTACQSDAVEQASDADHNGTNLADRKRVQL